MSAENANAETAADFLIHYFRMIAKRAGIEWDSDYSAEIRNAVDRLMDAARDIAQEEIAAHLESEPHLHADGSAT
jgi:hypothetical protein